jgi:uncharacterized protein
MHHRTLVPPLLLLFLFVCLPAQTSPVSSNPRLAEILRLPALQSSDWQALFSLAESGDPEAQYWLGRTYRIGRVLPQDQQKSLFWLQKSADQGYAPSQYELCAQRTMSDSSENERCLWHAAEAGIPEAQFWLGMFLGNNRFGVTDKVASLQWFRKAAEGGNADADAELCMDYQIGEELPVDFAQAAYWCRLAAEHVPDLGGAGAGRNNLGILYEIGEGVPQDYVQAYMWLSLAHVKENIAEIEPKMTAEEISRGKQLAADWLKHHPDPAIY